SELARGRADKAARCFQEILDPEVTPKFFLHWHWRLSARLGLCGVWIASDKRKQARAEAEGALEAALSTDDPNLRALAHDARARVAIQEKGWKSAEDDLKAALALAEEFEIPTTAWRVHATAADLFRRSGRDAAAKKHRASAEGILRGLV